MAVKHPKQHRLSSISITSDKLMAPDAAPRLDWRLLSEPVGNDSCNDHLKPFPWKKNNDI
jgi:hypothetical protein